MLINLFQLETSVRGDNPSNIMPYPLYLTGIYEDTYEKIKYKLQKEEEVKSKFPPLFFAINLHSFFVTSPPSSSLFSSSLSPSEPVDMFSDDVPSSSNGAGSSVPKPPLLSDEVMWEYRWKNEDDEEIHGPFSSTQMKEWAETK